MTRWRSAACLVAVAWLGAGPAWAHHSFGAEFDAGKPVTLKGVVSRIEWTNPHSHFSLDVKDDRGRTVTWVLTGYPITALHRTGWKMNVTMKVGDVVAVSGWRARDGTSSASGREVTLANGRKLYFGPPAGTGEGGATPAVKVP